MSLLPDITAGVGVGIGGHVRKVGHRGTEACGPATVRAGHCELPAAGLTDEVLGPQAVLAPTPTERHRAGDFIRARTTPAARLRATARRPLFHRRSPSRPPPARGAPT